MSPEKEQGWNEAMDAAAKQVKWTARAYGIEDAPVVLEIIATLKLRKFKVRRSKPKGEDNERKVQ